MTLALAWVRQLAGDQELVIASDSRLRFGCAWDACPKIFALPRSDAVICFAGDTMFAYPMMEQVRSAIGMYEKSRSRAMDIGSVRGHLLRVLTNMAEQIGDPPKGGVNKPPVPATVFILAGYSWLTNQFRTWILKYDESKKKFGFASPVTTYGNQLCLAGDYVEEARKRVIELMENRKKEKRTGFDMEPFEVLREICRDESLAEVGGAPQVLKVYRHMNTMPYAVYWPDRASNRVTFMGRPLLEYEMTSYLVLDPDSLTTYKFESEISRTGRTTRSVAVKVEGVSASGAVGGAVVELEKPSVVGRKEGGTGSELTIDTRVARN